MKNTKKEIEKIVDKCFVNSFSFNYRMQDRREDVLVKNKEFGDMCLEFRELLTKSIQSLITQSNKEAVEGFVETFKPVPTKNLPYGAIEVNWGYEYVKDMAKLYLSQPNPSEKGEGMSKEQVIEILKGLLMELEEPHSTPDNKALFWRNVVVREQNAKIQAVIDRLGKE